MKNAISALLLGGALLAATTEANAGLIFSSDCLPQHKYVEDGPIQYGPVIIRDVLHANFTECNAPPVNVGDTTIENFGSSVRFNVDGLGTFMAPGQVTVRLTRLADLDASTRAFQTEMLQLDILGGTLPPGVRIQESPTLHSLGLTTIEDLGGGQFEIDSFFDVFTELSLDNGGSWIPSQAPAHVVLVPAPGAPALLGLGLLALLACRRRARAAQ